MSSAPNVCLVAEIKPSINVDEFLENLNEDGEISIGGTYYQVIIADNNETGLWVNDDCFGINEFLTYGWGDGIEVPKLNEKVKVFEALVKDFCNKNNCTYFLKIQANWW